MYLKNRVSAKDPFSKWQIYQDFNLSFPRCVLLFLRIEKGGQLTLKRAEIHLKSSFQFSYLLKGYFGGAAVGSVHWKKAISKYDSGYSLTKSCPRTIL